jgi:hypothetical protein
MAIDGPNSPICSSFSGPNLDGGNWRMLETTTQAEIQLLTVAALEHETSKCKDEIANIGS